MTDNLFDEPDQPRTVGRGRAARGGVKSNMEFDFGGPKKLNKKTNDLPDDPEDDSYPQIKPPASESSASSTASAKSKSAPQPKLTVPTDDDDASEYHFTPPRGSTSSNFKSQSKPMTSSTTTPSSTFSQYQQNIQRQSREQKAVGNILSSMAIGLIASILIVALLAGFGGWMLWRQIQNQSVTVAQLDMKLTSDLQALRSDLKKTVDVLGQTETQVQAQKQQLQWLQGQLETVRTQAKKDDAENTAQWRKLDKRISDLERREAYPR